MQIIQSRRDFLASPVRGRRRERPRRPASLADEAPPEVTTIRLSRDPGICVAPQYVAEELLRAEASPMSATSGRRSRSAKMVARGEIDFGSSSARQVVFTSMPASRSRRWRVSIPDASSCSRTSPSAPSAT